ncbi:hypothetical protein [Streptomyces sp. NBC_01451]|uniref:hypothetical protein n=1 Tax=Streptomyces sp. NBC_01451 TaxID=2903872 RepID=UPI002E31EB9A|nr:hypothetical protein [Streptomyces sp. NBC_01451]
MVFSPSPRPADLGESAVGPTRRTAAHEDERETGDALGRPGELGAEGLATIGPRALRPRVTPLPVASQTIGR